MNTAPRKRGKAAELQVAKRLGGQRIHAQGLEAADIVGDWFVGEVKDYLKAPEVPYRELQKLKAKTGTDKLPLFIYKRPEWRNYVVCCLLSDFEDWYGTLHVPARLKGRVREAMKD